MKTLLVIIALLFPVSALAGSVDIQPGGSGSIAVSIGGSGSVQFIPAQAAPTPPPADGEIGNTTVLDNNARALDNFWYSSYTPTAVGQVGYCWVRVDPGVSGDDFTIGLYETDGTLLAYHNITNVGSTSVGWYGGALNTAPTLGSGPYIIGVVAAQNTSISKDGTEAGHYRRGIAMTYSTTLANTSFASYSSVSESSVHNYKCNNTGVSP